MIYSWPTGPEQMERNPQEKVSTVHKGYMKELLLEQHSEASKGLTVSSSMEAG